MNRELLYFAVLFASSVASADETSKPAPPATCPLSTLVSSIGTMARMAEPPSVPESSRDTFRTISLYEPIGTTDQFLYAALIDSMNDQAWVYQYGGYAGVSNWYGPIKINVVLAEKCQNAKAIIPINLSSQQQGGRH